MKELIILVGNIGSGKSTLTKKYQEDGYVVIARDCLRYAIGGGTYVYNVNYEPIIFDTELHMLEAFLKLGVNLVIDEVGVSKAMRMRYILPAKDYGYTVKCHVLPQLLQKTAVDRRMQNPHGQYDRELWKQVWDRFQSQYEEPSFDEGIDEIIRTATTGD